VITALDTNVLIDVFGADPEFGPRSRDALRTCIAQGGLVACDVVLAEVVAGFDDQRVAAAAFERLGVRFVTLEPGMALDAGAAWRSYRRRSRRRDRVIADFLIGAHAARAADRLLTRDRGFYATYFKGLEIVDPSRSKT
jgi:predicted nucleic acid-binding protein